MMQDPGLGHRSDAESEQKDVHYDGSDPGRQVRDWLAECRAAAIVPGAQNPVAHLVSNIVSGTFTNGEDKDVNSGGTLLAPARGPVFQLRCAQ